MWGGSAFSHEKGGVGKIGVVLKKGSIICFYTNSFQCYLSLSVWCASVCFVYLHYFHRVFFVFHRKNLVLLNTINRYVTSIREKFFENQRHQQLFIQWNTNSCCEHIRGGSNIYLYEWVSLLALVCVACLCLCVWYQIRVLAKNLVMCQTSVNLITCCIKQNLKRQYRGSS